MDDPTWKDPSDGREYRFEFSGKRMGGDGAPVKVFEGSRLVGTTRLQGEEDGRLFPHVTREGGEELWDWQARELLRRAREQAGEG